MPNYPISDFREYFHEIRTTIRSETYYMAGRIARMAKSAYRKGGFSAVASTLERYANENRWRLTAEAILQNCDNWRYAIRDLEFAARLANDYKHRRSKS